MRLAGRLGAYQHGCGAIHDAGGVAGVVHMVDAFDLRVARQRHLVEAHGAQCVEGRFERSQAGQCGVGFDEFVEIQNRLVQEVLDRHHRAGKVAAFARQRGAALALERKRVHVLAPETLDGGDQVGANALRHKRRRAVGLRVLGPGTAIRTYRHPAHAFHATGHHQVFPAGAHLLRRHVHGLQARGAKAVELHARTAEVPPGLERRYLGDHRALLANWRDHSHHHVVHLRGVEVVALLQCGQHAGQQVDGFDLVQAAVFLALAAWRADGVVNECFGHGVGSW